MFNSHLQIEGLRGNAVLAVDTKKGFRPRPQVSTATILSLSDQRPSMILWSMVLLWSLFCLYQHRRLSALGLYGGLALQDGRFINAKGCEVKLTPMQQQLMEMLWKSPSHQAFVESRDLRCPLAQEARCQRDTLHPYPTPEAHHRRTFRPQNRVRQGQVIRSDYQIDRFLSDNCQINVRQFLLYVYIIVVRLCSRLMKRAKHYATKNI